MKEVPENQANNKDRWFVAVFIVGLCFIFLMINVFDKIWVYQVTKRRVCDSYQGPLIPPPKILPFHWNHTAVVTLWFDDTWESQFTKAFPLMEKMGFKGALSVAIKFVCNPYYMNWDQLRLLQSKGWETTSHSVMHHCDLAYYNQNTINQELLESKKLIQARGLRADQFVMPCGYSQYDIDVNNLRVHPQIADAAKKYYASYRSTDGVYINPLPVIHPYALQAFEPRSTTTDEQIEKMVQTAIRQKGWLILVFHQIGSEARFVVSDENFEISVEQFQRILEIVKRSGLHVVLPTQALAIGHDAKRK